jgi:gamma-glutamyl hercynylcysteine S-oxide synthase
LDIYSLNQPDVIARELKACKDYTQQLYNHLTDVQWQVPYLTIINPMAWELAHIAWFQEHWCLRRSDNSESLRDSSWPSADALFDSRTVAHRARWHEYAPRAAIYDYQNNVLNRTLKALTQRADSSLETLYFFQLCVLHERMHQEAMLMTLNTLGLPLPSDLVFPVCRGTRNSSLGNVVHVNAGKVALGCVDKKRFAFDNELTGFTIEVPAFDIDLSPVSNGAFKKFVEASGYTRRELWSDEGWRILNERAQVQSATQTVNDTQVQEWQLQASFEGPPDAPVTQVSWHEAQAYCRFVGRQLPSEAQWMRAFECVPEFTQYTGQVWEWMRDTFKPFDGFKAGPYAEYSEPWFHTHQLLKGGSFATNEFLKYPQYRNFYTPERTDIFSGFRTCRL